MARQDVELVERMWNAFMAGDADAALAAFHPDVEWDGRNLPDGRVAYGHEAIRDHLRRWSGMWEQWKIEPGRFPDAGEGRVVVLFHERGRSSSSGLEVDEEHAELYTVEDGLIVRRQAASTAREAMREAGLE